MVPGSGFMRRSSSLTVAGQRGNFTPFPWYPSRGPDRDRTDTRKHALRQEG